jgi:hypothetical protein
MSMPAVPRFILIKGVDGKIDHDNMSQVTDDIHFRQNPPSDCDKSIFSEPNGTDSPWKKRRGPATPTSPPTGLKYVTFGCRGALHAVNANIAQLQIRGKPQQKRLPRTYCRKDGRGYKL